MRHYLIPLTVLLVVAAGCDSAELASKRTGPETTATDDSGTSTPPGVDAEVPPEPPPGEEPTPTGSASMTPTDTGTDPWGVTTVELPGTVEEIAAVYRAMPDEVAGYPLTGGGDDEHLMSYGGDDEGLTMWNQGEEHRIGPDGPMTPQEFLSLIASSGELDVIGSVLDGDVVWMHASTTVGEETGEHTEYVLVCGEADGEYLFFFQAYVEDDLDALVEAFVATAAG